YVDIVNALKVIPAFRIMMALVLALSYYVILGGYDIVAFKYIRSNVSLKPKDILFTCFISNVLANNTGYSMLFGGSIRYRLYSVYNVSMVDVTKVLFFSSATIWLGLLAIGGFIFTFAPVSLERFNLKFSTQIIGIVSLAILLLYVLLSILRSRSVKLFKWIITFPNIKIVVAQVLLATADWIVASLVFYALMPEGYISYFAFLRVFLVAQFVVIISQVPGGMGVFESSITLLLPHSAKNPGVIGALLVYRAVFYFFPLLIALAMLGSFEIMMFTKKFNERARIFGKSVSSAIIQVIALSSFFAGMVAMFSAATPFDVAQLKFVINLLPAWFADLSHFLLSIISIALLFISRALQLRIKNAWIIACVLVSLDIVLILTVGDPLLLLLCFIVLLIALLCSKKYFYREISILNTAFNTWWFSAVGGVFVISAWIGFFVNRQDIFSWIHLDVFFKNLLSTNDAARFLRASLGMLIIIFIVILEQISRNFFKKPVSFTKDDIKNIVYSSDYAYSLNALASDKSYIVNDEKDAFIMYAKVRNSLIVLGDPVGRYSHKNELLWKCKEITDSKSLKPAFVGIDHKYVRIYDDVGLDVFNMGQEAKILLSIFNKEDYQFKDLRDLESDVEALGFTYKVLPATQFEQYRGIFAKINKEWEANTNYIERNFIPGKYDDSYMNDMDFGVLEKNGEIYAFSVIGKTKNKHELSSGIVRYVKCDKDIFTYIVFKNILLAKSNGYKWFNMGLAYDSSMDSSGDVIKYFAKMFMFAEHFNHNLSALRNFKDKFCPMWHNKYIAIHPDKYIIAFIKNFTELISPPKIAEGSHFLRRFFKR
ncbi:MAG: phosphatidylglycerol lysyltransferase domain-containing protein, partial [Endomicrobium sp.]|uniref:phosphatidylglycerol lysyltransferase domain-containing protein n=1 Tax=Candidatus Endomicrobiellum pyrsonymphae TaxID=1408203 RepID=UPI003582CCB5|nr:phosphatidylglycerol lysyltransferase domain-containing protein [Endomicrobium sp.]